MDKQMHIQNTFDALANSAAAVREKASWRDFVQLTKPGILRSNLFAAFAGYWVASQWSIAWGPFLYMLLGTTLILAASCVFNNYLDRELDQKMARTRKRALPSGRVQPVQVLVFGLILGASGLAVLGFAVNLLCAVLGLIGMIVYVGIYTAWLKRTSTLSTVMGSFSGSMPPVIGYCAVTGQMDMGAWILFAILFFWQPPHFWALGIRRTEEYRAAGFMILPVVKGIYRTKLQMIPYVLLLVPATVLLYTYGYVGIVYLLIAGLLGLAWLVMCIVGLKSKNDDAWAKKNFIFSINYLTITMVVMILNTSHV